MPRARKRQTVGYLRVSKADQDVEKNKADILSLANELDLGKVEFVEEKVSGRISWKKRKLAGVVERLGKNHGNEKGNFGPLTGRLHNLGGLQVRARWSILGYQRSFPRQQTAHPRPQDEHGGRKCPRWTVSTWWRDRPDYVAGRSINHRNTPVTVTGSEQLAVSRKA